MDNFIITPDHNFKDEIKRYIFDQVDCIFKIIDEENKEVSKKIHDIRQRVKKIRAILMLVRYSVGYSTYYRENHFFREIGQRLSQARDNEIFLERIVIFRNIISSGYKNAKLKLLLQRLTERRDLSLAQISGEQNAFTAISDDLRIFVQRLKEMDMHNNDFVIVEGGLYKTYSKCLNYLNNLKMNAGNDAVHEFRKHVKYLWYQLIPFSSIYPVQFKAYCKSLEYISQNLGMQRDINLFYDLMEENRFFGLTARQQQLLVQFSEKEKEKVFSQAMEEAAKFFIEKPNRFRTRILKYYEIFLTNNLTK